MGRGGTAAVGAGWLVGGGVGVLVDERRVAGWLVGDWRGASRPPLLSRDFDGGKNDKNVTVVTVMRQIRKYGRGVTKKQPRRNLAPV